MRLSTGSPVILQSELPRSKCYGGAYSGVTMNLDRDFNEFLRLFLAHDVRFLVVGGYALAAHGLPRATGDLDTWIWINEGNAANVTAALRDFGFSSLDLSLEDFNKPDSVVQLGYPPHRIDILTEIDGVLFDQAWVRRVVLEVDGMQIPFIGREDLIANKTASSRLQDLADVARLTGRDLGEDPGPSNSL